MKDSDKSVNELLKELALLRQENTNLKSASPPLQALSKQDEQLLLLDTISTHVFYLSDPATYGVVNNAHAEFFGVEKSALEYKSLYELLGDREAKICIEGNKRIFTDKKQIVTEELLEGADGKKRLFAFTKTPKVNDQGKVEYVVCTGEDITERKNAERLLAFTQFTIDQAKIAIFWCRADGRFFYVNPTACEWLMYTFDELKQMHVADINPEFPREDWEAHWQDIKAKGLLHMESFHRRKNGEVYPVELYSNYVKFEGEEYKLSFVSDISDKVQTREALKSSQFFLENVIESIQDGVSVLNNDYTIVHTNAVMREWYKESGALIGQKCFQAYHGNSTICDFCPTRKAFASGSAESKIVQGLSNSSVEWLEVFSYPLKDQNSGEITGVVEFVRDISDRVRIEKHLAQAHKMEAIGTLAGGIAHDFNNLLLGIQGRSSLMAVDLESSHPHLDHIRAIEGYIRSATNLTNQLLGVARGGKYEPRPTDMNTLLANSASMFGRTKKEIKIRTQMLQTPVVVEVDRQQIEQVLLNIYINAWQAMPDGGEICLEINTLTLDEVFCKPYEVVAGRYARVSITDTGIGMNEATRQQIFDPFFTTKDKARGTGLGLASAYGIIKNHQGFITVYSEINHGTTFNIYLPASDKKVHKETTSESSMIKGSESILLVDDEELVIEVGQAMLEKIGYQVIIAKGGEQAVDRVKAMGEEIDLIILDLIMPGMDGGKTFDQIRKLQPEIPVILSSGYAINGQAADIMRRGCNGFLQKPFNISKLSQKIKKILIESGKDAQIGLVPK